MAVDYFVLSLLIYDNATGNQTVGNSSGILIGGTDTDDGNWNLGDDDLDGSGFLFQ